MPLDRACRVAIVGAGYTAREHIRAFKDVAGVELCGIHSRTRHRAEGLAAEFGIPAVADSVSELYERTNADLFVVTVSEIAARQVSSECFDFPAAVLMEKPPGIDLAEAEAIKVEADSRGRKVCVALNRRFYSSMRSALTSLNEQAGRRFICIQDQQNLRTDPNPSYSQEVIDRWMFANSLHVIDLMRMFGRGEVRAVTPVLPWNGPDTDVVVSKIEFSSGDAAIYEGLWQGPGPWAASISVPGVRWEMRPLEEATFQPSGSRKRESAPAHPWDTDFKPGFRAQAEMAALAAIGQPSESITLADAVESMRLVDSIFQFSERAAA